MTLLDFLSDKAVVVVCHSALDGVVRSKPGLDYDVASLGAASSPARHLSEQLVRSLGASVVGEIDSDVGVDDAHKRHVWKIEALGDHLSAEEYVYVASGDSAEYVGVRPFSACGIDVHARNSDTGHPFAEEPFDLLCSESALLYGVSAATSAYGVRGFSIEAVVAG